MSQWPQALAELVEERLDALIASAHAAGVVPVESDAARACVRWTLLASDHAAEIWQQHPDLLSNAGLAFLSGNDSAAMRAQKLTVAEADDAMQALRAFRHREALRLIFRAVNELDDLAGILADTSVLYETLLAAALARAEQETEQRFGQLLNADGARQQLVVLGMGKLGGDELNFSSDIDLILAYPESGVSDGRRQRDAGEYFTRLTQRLINLLAEPRAAGVAARVDLRLRPFGQAGRLALPFEAMEQYYQREGRDWERYAWVKARPVAGDVNAGNGLLQLLRPFVFRRYLDYTAFAGLRDMKSRVDAEVTRRDLADNIKLGPGGIREIEFIVQLMQLIRGGREPGLRVRNLLSALAFGEERGFIDSNQAQRLRDAYRFLRRLENRLQMLGNAQTHDVPEDAQSRQRIALGLGYADWASLAVDLDAHRDAVATEFATVLAPAAGRDAPVPVSETALWAAAVDGSVSAADMANAGFADADADRLGASLRQLPASLAVAGMSPRGRQRLDRLMPQLLATAGATDAPGACLGRLLRLIQAIARRSAYLSLLEEKPTARQRLVRLFADSAFLAEQTIAQPLLLDDVLDPRIKQLPLQRSDIDAEITRALAALDERDTGSMLARLNELQASLRFRLGLAFLDGHADAEATAHRLAALAAAVVATVVVLAERELMRHHGSLPGTGSGFAVLGYGSLGGCELGFASDLDLVFVYAGERADTMSDGARPLVGSKWYQRLAQRVVHWLSVPTQAGSLYPVDTRLRPDGSKGLMVTTHAAFARYQQQRARTWEHQALLRARPVAGDPELGAALSELRGQVLAASRAPGAVHTEVAAMRDRWRRQRDRSDAARLDLKHGAGGLLDIQFLLQSLVLANASEHPELVSTTSASGLLQACRDAGLLSGAQADSLSTAHGELLARALRCTLNAQERVVPRDETLRALTDRVRDVTRAVTGTSDG